MGWTANTPYNTPAMLQNPTGTSEAKGVTRKIYGEPGEKIFISFRTFGGTEKVSNGQLVVEKTGVVETWYRPDITSASRLLIEGITYEVLGDPENIEMRNRNLVIKVRAIKGGA